MNLLRYFGSDVEGVGAPQLKVRNRSGRLVSVHCHPSKGTFSEAVWDILKDLEVTRPEFDEWLRKGRKAK